MLLFKKRIIFELKSLHAQLLGESYSMLRLLPAGWRSVEMGQRSCLDSVCRWLCACMVLLEQDTLKGLRCVTHSSVGSAAQPWLNGTLAWGGTENLKDTVCRFKNNTQHSTCVICPGFFFRFCFIYMFLMFVFPETRTATRTSPLTSSTSSTLRRAEECLTAGRTSWVTCSRLETHTHLDNEKGHLL